MITKDENIYQGLFADINKKFNYDDSNAVNDIGDYFMELDNIKQAVENGQADPYWLIIPGSEELFTIDANKRTITVPTDFAKNGIGVQGDHMAEVIYFSVDRYFDTSDLYEQDILIQYELPNGDRYLAKTINKTLKYRDNKVVFGWVITNDMTENAGNIKFSVRFYKRSADKTKLTYSFGTLTSTIKVNSSLDFDIDSEEDISITTIDVEREYYANLRSSNADSVDTPAAAPIFIDLTPDPGEENSYDLDTQFSGRAKFDKDNLTNLSTGTITYNFRYANNKDKNNVIEDMATGNDTTLEYYEVEVSETNPPDKYEAYYTKEENAERDYYVVYPYSSWESGDEYSRPKVLYKVKACLYPDKAGAYYLCATNTAGRGNFITVKSDWWVVPFAKEATIIYDLDAQTDYYKHVKLEEDSSVELAPQITSPDKGQLTYQWYKVNDNGQIKIDEANEATYEAKEEGRFVVEVENMKNKDTTKVLSEEMRVSYPPALPVISEYQVNGEQISNIGSMLKDVKKIGVVIKSTPYSDIFTYQWYEKENEELITPIEGANDATLSVLTAGKEYCVEITNTYNTFTEKTTSEVFSVFSIA